MRSFLVFATLLAAAAPQGDIARIRGWMTAARYDVADSAATALLARAESAVPVDSLAIAHALDLQVEARALGSRGAIEETQTAAELSYRIKDARLPKDDPDRATSLANLGEVLRARGRYAESQANFAAALALREKAEGPMSAGTAKALNDVAKSLRDLGRTSEAVPLFERALAIREKVLDPNDPELAVSLLNLGNIRADTAMVQRALAIRRRAFGEDHILVSRAWQAVAILERNSGDYEAARKSYARALESAQRVLPPDHPELARFYTGVGNLAWATADYERARVCFETALAITRKARGEFHPETQAPLTNLGVLALELGDDERAAQIFRASLDVARQRGDMSRATAPPLNNLGIALSRLGRYAEADSIHRRAIAVWSAAEGDTSHWVGEVLNNLAEDELDEGRLDAAKEHSQRALAILEHADSRHPEIPTALENLGLLANRAHDFETARADFARALELRRATLGPGHPFLARSLVGEASALHALGRELEASHAALEAESIRRQHLRATARFLPERQALRYEQQLPSGLDVAISVAATSGNDSLVAATWDALVRSRALVLDEMASRRRERMATGTPETAALERAVSDARRRLAALTVRGPGAEGEKAYDALLEQTRAERERAEQALLEKSPQWRRARARDDAGLAEARRALPVGAALVSYVRYHDGPSDAYAVFFERRNGPPAVLRLGRADEIDWLVARWRANASRSGADDRVASRALRASVWDPVARMLGAPERVVIVPDGALQLVNFAALRRADGTFLVESGPTFQLVSAERDLAVPLVAEHASGFLVVGGVDFDADPAANPVVAETDSAIDRARGLPCMTTGFTPLPETAREADAIEALWSRRMSGGPFRLLEGAGATEAAFKQLAPTSRYLHLATHGFFLDGCDQDAQRGTRGIGGLVRRTEVPVAPPEPRPTEGPLLRSGLVLAGANRGVAGDSVWTGEDGILTADEIAGLDLSHVESAVLSGCETGVGSIRPGEGVFGLRRAFEIAGVRGLVMSLWSVGDRATREWMELFYAARLDQGRGPADAVRDASRAMIAARRAARKPVYPRDWAAFIATGP